MNELFPHNVSNLILYPEHLINYDAQDPRAFQWRIESTFASRIQLDPDRTIEVDFITNQHKQSIKGFVRWIDGVLHFQLKLTSEVAESVIPRVPEHVRQAHLEHERLRREQAERQ